MSIASKILPTSILLLLLVSASTFVSGQESARTQEADVLCDRLIEINALPRDKEKGADENWDAVIAAGDSVLPCLIDKIADTTIMDDPRCPVFTKEFRVGDLAFFAIVQIAGLEFTGLLPAEVRAQYETEGAYAYHYYVERDGARKELQSRLREWYKTYKKR